MATEDSNWLHITTIGIHGKYWPRTQEHNRPIGPENRAHISHDMTKWTDITRSAYMILVWSLATDDQEKLPNGNCCRTQKWHGADVGKADKEKRCSGLPTEGPSNNCKWKHKVGIAIIAVEGRNIAECDVCRIRSANGTVDAESNEVSSVVTSDTRAGKKAVVVANGYTVPTERTVVGTRWDRDSTVDTLLPITARQRAVGHSVAETGTAPD